MKKKIPRILGVALTLMLLTSLTFGFAVAPAGATTGKWNAFTLPAAGGPGGNVYSTDFTNAQYLTKTIDGTLYAYNNDSGARFLWKSTDDGRSWARVGGATINAINLVDIACSSEDADTLWVASEDTVYVSTNAATGFSAMVDNALLGDSVITSIDVGYVGDSAYVFMGTADADLGDAGGVYVLGPSYGSNWTDLRVNNVDEETKIAWGGRDVYEIKAAPDFPTSQVITAIITDESTAWSSTKYAGTNWSATVADASVGGLVPTTAQIAFPDDFSSVKTSGLMEYFVGIDAVESPVGTLDCVGGGSLNFSTAKAKSGSYSAKLYVPDGNTDVAYVVIDTDIALNAITDLSFQKFVTAYGASGFDPGIWLFVDADDDEDLDFTTEEVVECSVAFDDPAFWAAHGGDAIIWVQAEAALGAVDTDWVEWDAFSQFCWESDAGARHYASSNDLDTMQSETVGVSDPTDTVMKVVIMLGGSSLWMGETAYIDDITINTTTYDLEYGDATGDVFRIVLDKVIDRNIAGAGTATAVTGLDMVGSVGAALIIAGKADALGTYVSTDHSASWTKSKKAPVGAGFAAWIVMADDFAESGKAWAATSGAGGGVYLSVDSGLEWNGVGLLDTNITGAGAAINDFAIGLGGSETVFVAIHTVAGSDNLWRHDGTNWEQVYADQLGIDVNLVAVTDTFSADTTVFIADTYIEAVLPATEPTTQIARSTDGGDRWGNQLGTPTAINSWIIQSPSELLVGGVSTVHQTTNNGTTWNNRAISTLGTIMSFAKSPEYDTDTTVVCGDNGGMVARSVNAGVNWAQIPAGAATLGTGEDTFVTFNQQDATQVFAVAGAGGIFRYTFGAAGWQDINAEGNTSPDDGSATNGSNPRESDLVADNSTGIVCVPDGALYVADSVDVVFGDDPAGGVVRSINPTAALTPVGSAPYFEVANTGLKAGTLTAGRLIYTPGSNKVWMYDSLATGEANKLWYYDDACTASVTGLASSIGQAGGNLSWGAVDSASQYVVWYNRADLAWSGAEKATAGTNGLNITGLASGTKYHFRVCVNTQKPALSPWSAAFEFTTKMGAAAWSPIPGEANFSPAAGATGVDPVQTLFQWNPSAGAVGYEFQLSDNASFAGADTKKVKTPAYGWPGDLEYGKTYYWRVRAYKADTFSEWATAIFTTAEVSVAPTPPVVVQPSPPPPSPTVIPQAIPDYLLVTIIAIGAVLVIALIVLIVKTRRVT